MRSKERGVYQVRPVSGFSADQVLAQVEELERAASTVNEKITGGIGGSTFKLPEVI